MTKKFHNNYYIKKEIKLLLHSCRYGDIINHFINQPKNHIDGTDGTDCEYNNIGKKLFLGRAVICILLTFFTCRRTEYALSDIHILHLERKCDYAACPYSGR